MANRYWNQLKLAKILANCLMKPFVDPINKRYSGWNFLCIRNDKAYYHTPEWYKGKDHIPYFDLKVWHTDEWKAYLNEPIQDEHRNMVFKYHAWYNYIIPKFIEWQQNCKGNVCVFYRELPPVFFKVIFKQLDPDSPYSNYVLSSYIPKRRIETFQRYATQKAHKKPTHIDEKFYNWLKIKSVEQAIIG